MNRLIITNGDMAAERIQTLQPEAMVLPWRDVLHDGPLGDFDRLQDQSIHRAAFIAEFADMAPEDVVRDFEHRDQVFLQAGSYERVELWFEQDLYDQLQLLQIIDAACKQLPDTSLYVVQADTYLCELPDMEFAALPSHARLLTKAQKDYAVKAWAAVVSEDWSFADQVEAPLPYVPSALKRLQGERQDFPLSLYYASRPLLEGPMKVKEMFRAMQAAEEAKFMGDLSFYHLLKGYLAAPDPLFKSAYQDGMDYMDFFNLDVSLTGKGQEALKAFSVSL
ncbi:hypothetical protein [Terasakiella pusilla]|uniref:hypothetical protein n=1 Tax=Terasakiella pusilla TaxID=64973 RepID=UPI003AA94BF8